jgi:hypothetical protein
MTDGECFGERCGRLAKHHLRAISASGTLIAHVIDWLCQVTH